MSSKRCGVRPQSRCTPNGVDDKPDAPSFEHFGRMKLLCYQTPEIRVRLYDNAAIVSGRLRRTRSMNGRKISDDWRFTKVYVHEANEWRVISFHASDTS
jgi:hypothetical protein